MDKNYKVIILHLFKKYLFYISLYLVISSCNSQSAIHSELLFWCSNNKDEITFSENATQAWNKLQSDHPVHMQPVPEGQSSEEVILAAVVGKTTPDIYANMLQGVVEMYVHAKVVIPLDTLKGFMDFMYERCDSSVIREITSADGHIYQVPWKSNPIMTIYNKTLFAENKITALPTTYSTFLHDAEIFKLNSKQKGLRNYFGYTEVKPIWYQRLFNFYPLYLAASDGAPLIKNNKAVFNNKYGVEVFRFLQTIYNNEYFSRESSGASSDPFVIQTIASKWTGPWEISYLNRIPDKNFEFDYCVPPVPDEHVGPVYTYANEKNMVIFSTCKQPQVAWDFIKTMIDKTGDMQFLQISGQLPRRKNLATDPFYKSFFEKNPMLYPFAKQLPFVKGIDNCETIIEVFDIISQEYEACVVYGIKTPEKAIADAEKAVNILLAGK